MIRAWLVGALSLLTVGLLAAGQATVTRNVNLRPTAATDQPAIRLLEPPEVVTLLEPAPTAGFYHVKTSQGDEGWVWAKNVSISADPATLAPATSGGSTAGVSGRGSGAPPPNQPGGEAVDMPTCPAQGLTSLSGPKRVDDEQRNLAKRHIPDEGPAASLSLADFVQLEADVDALFHLDPTQQEISIVPDRHMLAGLKTTQSSVSLTEGDRVQIAGYINKVRAGSAESVNCGTADGADIHVNIGPKGGTEYAGIVVEVIPQWPAPKPAGWVQATFERLATAQAEVLAVGGLTLDNAHKLNNDPAHPLSGQPARLAMWEIHPVVEVFVCAAPTCEASNPAGWTTLTAWAATHGLRPAF
jgi:hypothetical protein